VALLVAVILGGFGAGAAFLPAGFLGRAGDSNQTAGVAAGASTEAGADATQPRAATEVGNAAPTAKASPSPAATKRKPAPARTSPSPRQTPTRTDGGNPAGGTAQQQVVALVNQERSAGGCRPVTVNAKLTRAAQLHSEDQAAHNTMSHTGSDGSSPWDRSKRAGYANAIGENVAAGYRTAQAVMQGWMNSPGHRANIMNCDAKAIGVGMARSSDGTPYWTQMFGSVA
jgi:uncharacterized protein YkwD